MIVRRPRFRFAGMGFYSGLGFDYWDLYNATNPESCDPKDSGCVARNQAKANAAEDTWINNYMSNPNTANMATPSISVALPNQQALTSAFMANAPVEAQISIPTYTPPAPAPAPAPAPVIVPPVSTVAKVSTPAPQTGSAGQKVVNSSGPVPQDMTGGASFSASSIPWWGWAAAAGFAFFVLGGRN